MTEEVPAKRKGRGLGKRPAMFNTSVRLPIEVMDYFNEHYPYSKQAMMREVLIEYVRRKTNKEVQIETTKPTNEGAKYDYQETRPTPQASPTPATPDEYAGLSEEEIEKLVAARYHVKAWAPTR